MRMLSSMPLKLISSTRNWKTATPFMEVSKRAATQVSDRKEKFPTQVSELEEKFCNFGTQAVHPRGTDEADLHHWDISEASRIAVPKSDSEMESKMETCLRLIEYIKENKAHSGVVFDRTKVKLSQGQYREGQEFDKVKNVHTSSHRDECSSEQISKTVKGVLGQGKSSFGDIIVVKDRGTGAQHAQKTIMISQFNTNEIRCWVDLNETGYVPHLYMFRNDGDKVVINMEVLETAKTLDSIIEEHVHILRRPENAHLLKPFSLYVLDGALEALCDMHKKGWTHDDLHSGNVMLDNELKIKIIDFGSAKKIENNATGFQQIPFQNDIRNAVRLFTGLFGGQYFHSVYDIVNNATERIEEAAQEYSLTNEDKAELFALIDAAIKITHPSQKEFEIYRRDVKNRMQKEMGDSQEVIMKKVAYLLFPEMFQDIHSEQEPAEDEADCIEDYFFDSPTAVLPEPDLDSVAAQITDQQINELRRRFGINL
ncbi:M3K14-like protein [Mya arenaria]|uniref:M3K14-like protein n=1 Tax=Mya arenaria TaxID=6604 RepID=A0ABY7F241_MYAAR|nr:M3K14-like protein [Mya arenaria]